VDIVVVLVAWLLVWAAGTLVVAAMRGPFDVRAPGEAAWTEGTGFFAGAFLVTAWMRALSALGIPFGVASIGLPLAAIAVAAAAIVRRRGTPSAGAIGAAVRDALGLRTLAGMQRVVFAALLAWLALRFALLFADVVLQPLYPWDAWIQWATKARVWFDLRRIVPFVDAAQWLAGNGAYYTDASPNYPATVPLWQVLSSVALGRFDDALMNVPWWLAALSLSIAIHGALRRFAFGPLASLAGATVVATLPILDMHVALAGYADLPMAAYFTLAALALVLAFAHRDRGDALVACLLAIACPTIKQPGIVWLATLAVPLTVGLLPRIGIKLVLAGFAATAVVLLVLAQTSATVLGYRLHLDFSPPWNGLVESLFMLGTWNVLWYGVVAAALIGVRDWTAPRTAPLTMLVAAGVLFLFFVFAFTNARAWVDTQTTVNRAILHLAPLVVVWAMLVFRAGAARLDAATSPAPR
jgi:hypothetical protein